VEGKSRALLTISLCRSTLGAAAVLGIVQDTKLTNSEFNMLGSAFYIGEHIMISLFISSQSKFISDP